MHFAILQTFQASLETSVRELATKQLSLAQSFSENQKYTFSDSSTFMALDNITKSQTLMQDFINAQQAFMSSTVQATKTFYHDQFAKNQASLKDIGLPSADQVLERVQAAVKKATTPAKNTHAKR